MEPEATSYLTLMALQSIYAIFAAQIAKRTNRSVGAFFVCTLIPLVGILFFAYVIWSTALIVLDTLNDLKAKEPLRGQL